MRLEGRKPGNVTLWIDGSTEEVVLRIQIDDAGHPLIGYKLYDSQGQLVEDSNEPKAFPDGLNVTSPDGEVLLDFPPGHQGDIAYRLYNRGGALLTHSDGLRTQVYSYLRMEGKGTAPYRQKK
jgi:hypothetical protein